MSRTVADALAQDHQDDAAVLGAAFAGVVRRDRLFLAVGDGRHPVQRDALLAQIAADRLGPLLP